MCKNHMKKTLTLMDTQKDWSEQKDILPISQMGRLIVKLSILPQIIYKCM